MGNEEGAAIAAVQRFYRENLENRDLEASLSCLCENVQWVGTGAFEIAEGKDAAKKLIQAEHLSLPGGYNLTFGDFSEKEAAPGVRTVLGTLTAEERRSGVMMRCRLTALCVFSESLCRISELHMSVPNGVQEGDEFFPLSYADEKEALRRRLQASEAHLRQLNYELQTLMSNVPGGIAAYEYRQGVLSMTYFNDPVCLMAGYSREEYSQVCSGGFSRLIQAEDLDGLKEKLDGLLKNGEPLDCAFRVRRKDGSTLWVRQRSRVTSRTADSVCFSSVFIDVSELKEKEQKLQAFISNISGCVVTLVFTGGCIREIRWGEGMGPLMGNVSDGGPERMEKAVHPDDRQRFFAELHDLAVSRKARLCCDFRLAQTGGGWRWMQLTAVPYCRDGDDSFFCGLCIDIDEAKQRDKQLRWQAERYRILSEGTDSVIFDYDPEKDALNYSFNCKGKGRQERSVQNFLKYVKESGRYDEKYIIFCNETLRKICKKPGRGSVEYQKKTVGGLRWYSLSYVSLADEAGRIYRVVGRVNDIQSEKEREESLLSNAARESAYRRTLTVDAIAAFEFDLDEGKRVPSDLDVWPSELPRGITLAELRMWFWYYAVYPDDRSAFNVTPFGEGTSGGLKNGDVYVECRARFGDRPDQPYRWVGITFAYIEEPQRGHRHVFICVRDVNSLKLEQIRLKDRAERDSLTDLINRASCEQLVTEHLASAGQDGILSAFFVIDLDNFKSINDTYGHTVGDEVLVSVAQCLRSMFRAGDVAARLGGDEMAVFMSGVTSAEAVSRKASEICSAFRNLRFSEPAVRISCSIGVALVPEDGGDFTQLYKNADFALYRAKLRGKNQYALYKGKDCPPLCAVIDHFGWSAQ